MQLPVEGSLMPLFRAFDLVGEGEGWTEEEGSSSSAAFTMQVSRVGIILSQQSCTGVGSSSYYLYVSPGLSHHFTHTIHSSSGAL